MLEKTELIDRWSETMRLLKTDPIVFYKRALERKLKKVKWLRKKIHDLEAKGYA